MTQAANEAETHIADNDEGRKATLGKLFGYEKFAKVSNEKYHWDITYMLYLINIDDRAKISVWAILARLSKSLCDADDTSY